MQVSRRQGRPPVIEKAYDRILDEAAMLFGQKGFDASSINEVATSIGISKAAIFHYFPAKQDIYDAIIVRTLKGLKEAVSEAIEQEEAGCARLECFMVAHGAYFEEHFWSFVTMLIGYGGMGTSGLKQEALSLRDDYEALLRSIIAEGIERGQLKPVDTADTGRAILSMLNWMARWFTPGGSRTAAEIAQSYYTIIVGGLELPTKD
ncbi:TetR/AcrR family transcriptional regulator (plasmid) [Agrobacterium leguminum]|uniref:Transcriptional regulator, TetR-family n=1 Tax=Agrobacterium deltaense NCPPB 1641 TaxID=1183425 RepID=A0A1S7U9C3_9HYPH|nr:MULTISPECIES: TetR/AcrR family transcriptional regulator [Agrobacterium]WFS70056.1 TetR/AcrR family transcriptional regulator [Agrobacterium leguminum]CVI63372.1 Transcriptional regulator, TetR-family [Agrobacterium deltaense NCPPB 1641]